MIKDWLIRCGNGENVWKGARFSIWGIESKYKTFIKTAKPGDRMWFVQNNSKGKLIAVATFRSCNERILGPLIKLSLSDEELCWKKISEGKNWDYEVHYEEFYDISGYNLLTEIKPINTIISYDNIKICKVDLENAYINICLNS